MVRPHLFALTEGQRWVRSFDSKADTTAAAISSVDRPAGAVLDRRMASERQTDAAGRSYVTTIKPLPWERFTVPSTDGTLEIDAVDHAPGGAF